MMSALMMTVMLLGGRRLQPHACCNRNHAHSKQLCHPPQQLLTPLMLLPSILKTIVFDQDAAGQSILFKMLCRY
jgi:hypothetical protein